LGEERREETDEAAEEGRELIQREENVKRRE
jgi:hypothetical protein